MGRPKTSQLVIDIISLLVDHQDMKGIEKYGVSIDEVKHDEYDWNVMALEEMVDGMKYCVKEIQSLREENTHLRNTIRVMRSLQDFTGQ
jgi:hypothetical protein